MIFNFASNTVLYYNIFIYKLNFISYRISIAIQFNQIKKIAIQLNLIRSPISNFQTLRYFFNTSHIILRNIYLIYPCHATYVSPLRKSSKSETRPRNRIKDEPSYFDRVLVVSAHTHGSRIARCSFYFDRYTRFSLSRNGTGLTRPRARNVTSTVTSNATRLPGGTN